jgi:hypothetical protein
MFYLLFIKFLYVYLSILNATLPSRAKLSKLNKSRGSSERIWTWLSESNRARDELSPA